jgi:arylsulfatase A-like enzyme/Tfp pilus assembly protein PilF
MPSTPAARRRAAALAAASALAAGLLLLWQRRLLPGLPGERPRNVLLVSLDTTRADRLGCYGYAAAQTPRLDALAGGGLRFAQATTVVPLTLPAHASLMTGTFPGTHGVRDNGGFYVSEDSQTLAELLREKGYRTGGFVAAFVLDSRWGIQQGFERYFDEFDLSKYEGVGMDAVQRRGDEVVDKAVEWLAADRERAFFAWVHLYDPHAPYEAPEPYRSRFPVGMQGAYDAEVAYTDSLVGRLLDHLAGDGRLADTLVVVVGDHGESLGEHSEQSHGFFIYDADVQIPLILAGPGLPARVVPDQVRIVDVMPTVLELLGLEAPQAVQGHSLLPLARGERLELLALSESWYPRYHYGWSELRAVRDGRYKFVLAPRPELYDIAADPGELSDLAGRLPQRLASYEAALREMTRRVESEAAPKGPQSVDPEVEERLQALGYLGGGLSARQLEERPRGDPKDKIGLYNLLKQAGSASSEGRVEEAIAKVREALAQDPEIVEGYTLLGNFQVKAKRHELALEAYRKALELDPEHQGALFSLALAYKEAGRLPDAEAGFERARSLDPRNGKVLWQLADVFMQQRRFDRAEVVLKDALERKVDVPRFSLKLGECYLELERFDEAETLIREALRQKPDLKTGHYNLALVHEEKGDEAAAMAEYEAELKGNPKGYRASFNLARLLLKARRSGEAVRRFREAVEANPEFATGHLYLAKALLDTGDLAGAQASARKGLDAGPERKMAPLGHYVLADVYTRQGRSREAAREVAAARKLERGG